jgi:PAS domain S-box-containing protein
MSERRFREMADTAPAMLWVTDERHSCTFLSRAWTEFTGQPLEDGLGHGWIAAVHPDDRDRMQRAFAAAADARATFQLDCRLRSAEGGHRWVIDAGRPRFGADGAFLGYVGSVTDIHERKLAEDALRRTEAILQHAGAMARLGAWWIDAIDEQDLLASPLHWSDEVFRIFGYEPGEVEVSNALFFEHVHADDRQRVTDAVARAMASRRPYVVEHRILRRGGSEGIVLEYGSFEVDSAGRPARLVGAVQDVTEHRGAVEALRQSERDLNRAQAVACTGSWRLDVRRNELLWSDETHRLFNIPKGTLLTYEAFLSRIHPDDRALVDARWQAALRGEPYEVEHRIIVRDEVKWVRERAELEVDANGDLQGGFGTVQDITEAKRLHEALRSANERLLDADRRKDEFLAMLSHELRNPLAPIRNSIHVLRHGTRGAEQAQRAQDVIERQSEHLTRLVDDLLDVTRIARGKIELRRSRIELRDLVEGAADDFRSVMDERGVAFHTVLSPVEIWADADATRLAQVVGNLLHNAAKYTRRGDEVTLSLRADAGGAEIRVADTGVGIDPGLLPLVFEPFVQGDRTLARTEGGLGLGLALVKSITELHGGSVGAESAGRGHGTEFVVRLPLAAQSVGEAPHARRARETTPRRVLVVDDNRDSAESLAQVVEMLGHAAEVAYDAPSALALARANPPNVVVCDIGLPGMSGYEVAKALRAQGGAMQLIALSGYARPEDVAKALEAGFDTHVSKPCDLSEIERLLS